MSFGLAKKPEAIVVHCVVCSVHTKFEGQTAEEARHLLRRIGWDRVLLADEWTYFCPTCKW